MHAPTTQPKILAVYLGLLIDTVARLNISTEELLAGSNIKPEQLNDLLWYLDIEDFLKLYHRAITLTREPGLAFHMSVQMKVSGHGLIGFAAMIGKDIREALEVAEQFVSIISTAVNLRLEVIDDTAYFYITELYPEYALGDAALMALAHGFSLMGEAVTGKRIEGCAEFPFKRPDYYDRFEHLVTGTVRFEQAASPTAHREAETAKAHRG